MSQLVITDEKLEQMKKPEAKISVHGMSFSVDADCRTFRIGDVALDRKDGMHGVVDLVIGDKVVLRDGYTIEIGIPAARLIKLVPCRNPN